MTKFLSDLPTGQALRVKIIIKFLGTVKSTNNLHTEHSEKYYPLQTKNPFV